VIQTLETQTATRSNGSQACQGDSKAFVLTLFLLCSADETNGISRTSLNAREGAYSGSAVDAHMSVAPVQTDLFGEPLIPGLAIAPEIVSVEEESALTRAIDDCDLSPFRFQGWLGKRVTASFGTQYDFEKGTFGLADPIPEWLEPLRERAARFAGVTRDDLVQALVIRYDRGAGVGWHKDRPIYEHVIGISLGTPATMRFRRRTPGGFDRVSVPLVPRSIYHLRGEIRHEWEHSIAEMDQTRWSVTFRSLSAKGEAAFRRLGTVPA
jgi:alkylated DNA repair protein (DNA oxidative demethylase)